MYEPSEECITDFWSNGILKNLPVSSSNPNFIKAASQLRDSCSDTNYCKKMLREDYIRLFASRERPLAQPNESLYSAKRDNTLSNETHSVTRFYNSYGWKSKFKDKRSDDHLGVELLFLTTLIEKYIVLDDEACSFAMREEIRRYIDQHLFTWIADWNKNMQQFAETLCYKGIGSLIYACVEDIYNLIGENNIAMCQSNNLKN